MTAVTGIAYGGLGTAANLDDTQLWSLEDLREPQPEPEPEHEREFAPAAAAESAAPPVRAAVAVAAPARPLAPPRVVAATSRGRPRRGVLAAAAVGILALAAFLAMRDGLPGGAGTRKGDAAGAFPSVPAVSTIAPAPTAAPAGGNGHGGGKGNGGKNKD